MSDTPRTDEHVEKCDYSNIRGRSPSYDSLISFAKVLERENNMLRKALDALLPPPEEP